MRRSETGKSKDDEIYRANPMEEATHDTPTQSNPGVSAGQSQATNVNEAKVALELLFVARSIDRHIHSGWTVGMW